MKCSKNIINLTRNLLLAKGGERTCYIHPNDSSKIVKVLHLKGKHNRQNELDYIYMNYLVKRKINLNRIPKCYGWINTNKGKGLIFDRVLNYDKTDAKTFRYFVRNNLLDPDVEKKLLSDLENYLIVNKIVFVDVSLANVFCQEVKKGEFQLVVFDGLGGRRVGIKLYLYMSFIPFAKYKIWKQWKKFLKNVQRDKEFYLNQ